MITTEPNVNSLFSSTKRYRVPLYQRDYIWNDRNWEDLWEAISEKSDLRLEDENNAKSHFTGAIVIQDDAGNLEIIDGQQRLTTFQIIFCAIRDICKQFDEDPAGIVRRTKRFTENRGSSASVLLERYKLLPREGRDRNAFQTLIQLEEMETKKKVSKGPIHEAYVHFTKAIENYIGKDYNKLDKLFTTIKEDFILVQIIVDQDDDPEKIFQTINGTGQALDEFDLLRNNLFLRAGTGTNRAGTGTKRDELYEDHWEHFDREEFWRQGGVRDEFLWHFLKAKCGAHFKGKQKLFDEYQMYCKQLLKEKVNLIKYENPVEYEFAELSRYAEVYREMHDPNSDDIGQRMEFYKKFNNEFKLTLQLLNSFVLYITNELGLSLLERKQILDLLESYAVRRILCTGLPAPATEINGFFLDVLEKKRIFSLLDLWHLLSKEFENDEAVDSALRQLLPNFDKLQTQSSSKKSQQSQLSRLRKLGKYISDQIESHSENFKVGELRERFCKIWPSSEVLLQSCLKDGLPIVYSQLPTSEKVKTQLDPYIFVTYSGTKKLSKYEAQQDKMVGIDEDSDNKEEIELPLEKILFAFPATARSKLQPILNDLQDYVKNQKLTPIPKQEALEIKNLLPLNTGQKILDSKHWLLQNTRKSAVTTRAGHVLLGRLKMFNDDAIYIEINDQIVTVYRHGLYKLEFKNRQRNRRKKRKEVEKKMSWQSMIESEKNQPIKFMCNEGIIELSQIVSTSRSDITGFDNIMGITRQLSLEEILFAYSAKTPANEADLKFWTDMDPPKSAQPSSHHQELQVANSTINFKSVLHPQNRKSNFKVVTRSGYILQGQVSNHDKDTIYMRIKQHRVVVFKHALLEGHLITFGDIMFERETFKFITNEEPIILSQIETAPNKLTGFDQSGNQLLSLKKLDILFAYSTKAAPDVEPIRIDDRVEQQKLKPSWKGRKRFQLETASLDSAMAEEMAIRTLTCRGHVLEGTIEHFDKYEIHLRINGQTVIVYRHGIYELSKSEKIILT